MRKLLFCAVLIILAVGLSCTGKQKQNYTVNIGINQAQAAIQEQSHPMDSTMTPKAMADTTKASTKGQKMTLDKGIGPITEIKLDPIDPKLAKQGQALFNANCAACHTLDAKKTGPPLRHITLDHAPEFIMNMILNPVEMQKKNPEIIKLVEDYAVLMSDLHLKKEQARAILEYLRSEGNKAKPAGK
jgi:mono/diheme cytochrome c family protein